LLPYSPEFNPIEKNKLANRIFATHEDIVEACCDAWNVLIAMPDRIASITQRSWTKVS
jgi:transposase